MIYSLIFLENVSTPLALGQLSKTTNSWPENSRIYNLDGAPSRRHAERNLASAFKKYDRTNKFMLQTYHQLPYLLVLAQLSFPSGVLL